MTRCPRRRDTVPTNIPTIPTRANCRATDCPKIDVLRIGALVAVCVCGTLIVIFAAIDGVTVKEVIAIIGAAAWGIRIDRGQAVQAAKIQEAKEELKDAVDENAKVCVEAAVVVAKKQDAKAEEIKQAAKETAKELAETTAKTTGVLAAKLEEVHKSTNGGLKAAVDAAYKAGVEEGQKDSKF